MSDDKTTPKWHMPTEGTLHLPWKVTRVEVIDHSPEGEGRVWVKWDLEDVEISVQDSGRTLKVFVK